MSDIKAAFDRIHWRYGDKDASALDELEARIASAGRRRGLATYSDLVRGITFDLPNVKQPPFQIDVTDWRDFDRAVIGDFLGYISERSYDKAGFFASALVVGKLDGSPGWGYYDLLKQLDLIPAAQSEEALGMWADHVRKAHTWFERHR